jgi:hypothetical protein
MPLAEKNDKVSDRAVPKSPAVAARKGLFVIQYPVFSQKFNCISKCYGFFSSHRILGMDFERSSIEFNRFVPVHRSFFEMLDSSNF